MSYPPGEPYESGWHDTGDGNRIWWAASGNPHGKPVLILHGGPGSGSSASTRRFFDPSVFRILQFDQRGCGLSQPHAGDAGTDLSQNTTAHLIADIEGLRRLFGVEQYIVFGTSWGSTLALAYAERHPEHVAGMILAGVTMTRRREIDWLYRGLAAFFPQQWEQFNLGMPEDLRGGDPVSAYYHLLKNSDADVRARAAFDWHQWEAASLSVDPQARPPLKWSDPRYIMARTRIITHYFHHNAWLGDDELLVHANRLADIDGFLIQGRLDFEGPPVTAWQLAKAWPRARLIMVETAGHSPNEQGMERAILDAVRWFSARETG